MSVRGARLVICLAGTVGLLASQTEASASDLFSSEPGSSLRGESISVEPIIGYLRGSSGEYVYNTSNRNQKLSQLDWNINALAVGGRVAIRPLDWLTVRGRLWATVSSGGDMTDYDWLAGYFGKDSWTHRSVHPDTELAKAWQGDVSLAMSYYADEDLALTVLAGYRHYDVKYNSRGGSFVYSSFAFRDTVGSFPDGQLAITYRQVWQTPYLGLGANYNGENWTVGVEVIGSPFVMARTRDNHVLRNTVFTDDFDMSGMVGVSAGVEYRFSPILSVTGRVEYQKYFETKGGTTIQDNSTGTVVRVPKPGAGADSDSLLLSVGVKTRI